MPFIPGLRWLTPWAGALEQSKKVEDFYALQQHRVEQIMNQSTQFQDVPEWFSFNPDMGLAIGQVITEKLDQLQPMQIFLRLKNETEQWIMNTLRGIVPARFIDRTPNIPYEIRGTPEEYEYVKDFNERAIRKLAEDPIGSILSLWDRPVQSAGIRIIPTTQQVWEIYEDPDKLLIDPYIAQGPFLLEDPRDLQTAVDRLFGKHLVRGQSNIQHPMSKLASRSMWIAEQKRRRDSIPNSFIYPKWTGPLFSAGREDILEFMTIENQMDRLMDRLEWIAINRKEGRGRMSWADWRAKKKPSQGISGLENFWGAAG